MTDPVHPAQLNWVTIDGKIQIGLNYAPVHGMGRHDRARWRLSATVSFGVDLRHVAARRPRRRPTGGADTIAAIAARTNAHRHAGHLQLVPSGAAGQGADQRQTSATAGSKSVGAGWMKVPGLWLRVPFDGHDSGNSKRAPDHQVAHDQPQATFKGRYTPSRTRPTIPNRPRNPIRQSPSAAAVILRLVAQYADRWNFTVNESPVPSRSWKC